MTLPDECEATLERCKQVDVEGAAKVKELENKIKNAKVLKEQEMKAAKAELAKCKKVAEETRSKWNLMKQVRETLIFVFPSSCFSHVKFGNSLGDGEIQGCLLIIIFIGSPAELTIDLYATLQIFFNS